MHRSRDRAHRSSRVLESTYVSQGNSHYAKRLVYLPEDHSPYRAARFLSKQLTHMVIQNIVVRGEPRNPGQKEPGRNHGLARKQEAFSS